MTSTTCRDTSVLSAPCARHGFSLSPHATQQLSETEAASMVTRRHPWQVCRGLTGMSRRFPSAFFESRTKANAGGLNFVLTADKTLLCLHKSLVKIQI